MAKIKATGDNFVILSQPKVARGAVKQLSQRLNSHSTFPAFVIRYTRADQFGDYLGKRFRVTLELFRLAHYFAFVFGPGPLSMGVGGAVVQHGTGNSKPPRRDGSGRTVYNGWEGSHVRLGTFSVNGAPVCSAWPARLLELAGQRGLGGRRVEDLFPANCRLANTALMLDAATDLTDALLNRVFGQLEVEMHKVLRVLAPPSVPADAEALQQWLNRLNEQWPRLASKGLRHFARVRLGAIQREPGRELMQEAKGPDGGPPMYMGELQILQALIAQIEDEGSELWQSLRGVAVRAVNDTAAEIVEVVRARAELLPG